jgi:hypothetical protein
MGQLWVRVRACWDTAPSPCLNIPLAPMQTTTPHASHLNWQQRWKTQHGWVCGVGGGEGGALHVADLFICF